MRLRSKSSKKAKLTSAAHRKRCVGPAAYDANLFIGLHKSHDPKRPAVRHMAFPEESTVKTLKPVKRATEGKVRSDQRRLLLNMLEKAYDNRIVLPFRMSDLRRARDSSSGVKITNGGPFGDLHREKTVLRAEDGPRLVVDLDEEIILTYLPGLIGKGLRYALEKSLDKLVKLCPPEVDKGQGDRRSNVSGKKTSTNPTLPQLASLSVDQLAPGAYYWSPGWYGTGQENVSQLQVSVPFRQALAAQEQHEVGNVLEAKRNYDWMTDCLLSILHEPLRQSMRALLDKLAEEPDPVGEVTRQGWTSSFPCVAFAFNRESGKHRDSKGIRGGLDVIGVLGSFSGGRLKFQDLNMEADWVPGCLGAFDGFDLTHEVAPWAGNHRIALISFCRGATWKGLKLARTVSHPSLSTFSTALSRAKEVRKEFTSTIFGGRDQPSGVA
ncbi:hypothetical protein FRC08_014948 [Ceratobasidium sp. 394]|nr:hypothetical protein FRC08_014948 [Ceratobasidium sp. 394]